MPRFSSDGKTWVSYDTTTDELQYLEKSPSYQTRTYVQTGSDFLGDTTAGGNLTAVVSGTSAQVVSASTPTLGRVGHVFASTGTTNTGRAALIGADTGVVLGSGVVRYRADVYMGTLSTGSERYTLYSGLSDSTSSAGTDTVAFRYIDNANSGAWVCYARSNSTESVLNSTVGVAAATWYTLEFEIDASASQAEFWINGVSQGKIYSNIPSGGARDTRILPIYIQKSVGTTSVGAYLDLYLCRIHLLTAI